MADTFLERHQAEYEKRKAEWLRKKKHVPKHVRKHDSSQGNKCLVLPKVDTFTTNKKCVQLCEKVRQSTAKSSS